jgi:hypothetical protein
MDKKERCDSQLELTVRCGLVIDAELGSLSAWTFMANSGVSEDIISRVLLTSEERRESDQIALQVAEIRRALHANPRRPSLLTLSAKFRENLSSSAT